MKSPFRILLPIDITNCPLEVFSHVNRIADKRQATLTLLHVVCETVEKANGATGSLLAAAKNHLDRLARKFVCAKIPPSLRIRVGLPAGEILAEAEEHSSDLIILTSYEGSSLRARPSEGEVRTRVLSDAPCKVSVLHVRTRFNCEEQWPLVDEIVTALNYVGLLKPAGAPEN